MDLIPSVYDTFKQFIKFDDGRYEVSLPWRSDQIRPPSNFLLAKRRLEGLLKRLRHHPEVLQEYNAIIQQQLNLGIVEKVSDEGCKDTDVNRIHYLPHHAVICTDKQTTKLRIVYDASAQDKGLSLNDCLFSGPKFDQNILDILLRFRTYKVALIADVEKAFLMISVSKEDRDSLIFLWTDDVAKPQPEIQAMRFTRVVFGVSASPFLLKHHPLTTLIVQHAHERTLHSGVKDTLTKVRSKYWLVKGRQFIRKIIYQCVVCRKLEGQHYRAAPPPPLPEFRVKEAPPFAYCGVDFAGPLYIRVEDRSESSKVWIALYTCCVTCTVHLELVPDMTTQTFLRSFKRFTARRGIPLQIISDNAKTFVSAALTLDKMLSDPEVQQYMAGLKVQWRFNLEKAPWQGGFFERMVQSMKRCLRKTIGKSQLSLDELTTVLVQVEAILNSRPISYVSSEDLEELVIC